MEEPSQQRASLLAAARPKARRGSSTPTLGDMAPLLTEAADMARPPVKQFLKHGLDVPVDHSDAGSPVRQSVKASPRAAGHPHAKFSLVPDTDDSEQQAFHKEAAAEDEAERQSQLKRQLEIFLLPDHPLLSSALLRPLTDMNASHPWMMHPGGKFRVRWDMTMVVLVLANVVLIPVQATYFGNIEEEIFQWRLFNLVSDLVFAADIIFNFRTGVVVEEDYERVVMEPRAVARSYLRGFFLIDLVSTVPWDYGVEFMLAFFEHEADLGDDSFTGTLRLLQVTKFLKLLKLIRLTRLVRYLDNVEQNYIAELASFGGKAIPASVKAMMPHLLTDGVAQQFSTEGRKGKERFRGLKLCQVIVDAVRQSKFLGDSPRSEVEIHIREWLRRAKERAAFGVKKT